MVAVVPSMRELSTASRLTYARISIPGFGTSAFIPFSSATFRSASICSCIRPLSKSTCGGRRLGTNASSPASFFSNRPLGSV